LYKLKNIPQNNGGDGFELSVPLHASSTGWCVKQATSRLMVVAFRDLDIPKERKRRPAAASPSPPFSNAGIVPWCYHGL
jgi:hypothetical protein